MTQAGYSLGDIRAMPKKELLKRVAAATRASARFRLERLSDLAIADGTSQGKGIWGTPPANTSNWGENLEPYIAYRQALIKVGYPYLDNETGEERFERIALENAEKAKATFWAAFSSQGGGGGTWNQN